MSPKKLYALMMCLSAAPGCHANLDSPPEDAFEVTRTVDGLTFKVSGPRPLTEEELRQVLPQVSPVPLAETAARTVEPKADKSGVPNDHAKIDLSGFSVELIAEPALTSISADGVGRRTQALSGPVTPSFYTYSGNVAHGGSVRYTLSGAISNALLVPTSADVDLFAEDCGGRLISSSTLAGTAPDYSGVYNSSGSTTCRTFRAFGYSYAGSGYKLVLWNYR